MDDDRRHLQERLDLLDGLLLAVDRRLEVAEFIASSADPRDAVRRVSAALHVREAVAMDVLAMQWRQLTQQGPSRAARASHGDRG